MLAPGTAETDAPEAVSEDASAPEGAASAAGLPMPLWVATLVLVVLAHQVVAALLR